MSNLTGIYSQEKADAAPDFSPAPEGNYTVMITEAEMKPTLKGGQRLALDIEIVDGEHKGKKLWGSLNLVNSNPTAEGIAQREFASICKGVGLDPSKVTDTSEIKMKPFVAKLGIEGYEDKEGKPKSKNVVASYETNGTAPQEQAAPPAAAQPAPARTW